MLNEVNIDFRNPGLPHSVVKHAQSTSVRELVQKIEQHPDRHALQQYLRQNQAYNPFSPESKNMIQEVGNVELFELLETDSKTQCKACLSYWSAGIVYCTCGHLLQETVANRGFMKYTMDFLSIPEYVIKKGRPHGQRDGKKPGDKEYYLANQLKKRCQKRDYQGIHERFLRNHVFRARMIENNRDEEVCRRWDVLADEDHTYHMSEEEYFYYKNKWWLHLNKSGPDTLPLRRRSDFKQAFSTLNRLHQETGEEQLRSMPYWEVQGMETGLEFFLHMVARARLPVVFLRIQRKSIKRWQAKFCDRTGQPVVYRTLAKTSDEWLSRIHSILLQIDRLQLTAVHCNRRVV